MLRMEIKGCIFARSGGYIISFFNHFVALVFKMAAANFYHRCCSVNLCSKQSRRLDLVGDPVDKMESIQCRGAHFVYRDYKKTSSVTSMLSNLWWEPLQDRRKIARLTMLQKIRQGQVAISAESFLQPASSRHSSGQLNHIQSYIKPTSRSDFYLQSYFPHTINDWNSLPEHIININDIQLFKSAVTSYICPSTTQHKAQCFQPM